MLLILLIYYIIITYLLYNYRDDKTKCLTTHPHRINRYKILNHSLRRLASQYVNNCNDRSLSGNEYKMGKQYINDKFNSIGYTKSVSMTSSHFVLNSIIGIILYLICILLYFAYRFDQHR